MVDVVYFLKESDSNPELVYSLRSIERNLAFDRVWFYGGKPIGLQPDCSVRIEQYGRTKWHRVRDMLERACRNNDISEDFYLFNDDFFILEPVESIPDMYNGSIVDHVLDIESRHMDLPSTYTMKLRKARQALVEAGFTTLNYAIHVPMKVNRAKMLDTLRTFPKIPMFRNMYGNMWAESPVKHEDVKIVGMDRVPEGWDFCSTNDASFKNGKVGEFIRSMFPDKSRWEA